MRLPARAKKREGTGAPKVSVFALKRPDLRMLERLALDLAQEWVEDSRFPPLSA